MHSAIRFSEPLVVRSPNWLGDAVMALPAVRNLKSALGEGQLTVATPEKLAALWHACPFVDHVLPLTHPRHLLKTAFQLAAKKFHIAVLLPNSLRSSAEVFLAGIPLRAGYQNGPRKWLLNAPVANPMNPRRQHHSHYFLELATALGAPQDATFPSLNKPECPLELTRFNRSILAICPGAEYGPAKRWPVERFIQVAQDLSSRYSLQVVLLGAPGDAPVAAKIAQKLTGAIDLSGQTTLDEFMGWLAHARLVLCNDSGAMHVASAFNTPTVAIFGSTEPRWTGPLGRLSATVRHHVPCSPCFLRDCPLDFGCMTKIEPEQVGVIADKLLSA